MGRKDKEMISDEAHKHQLKKIQDVFREEIEMRLWEWKGCQGYELIDVEIDDLIDNVLKPAQIRQEAIQECIDLSDKIEQEQPDGGLEQWKAFKHFRNTLRDRLALLKGKHGE